LQEVQSTEFPDDALERIEKANVVYKQLNGSGLCQTPGILLIPGMASHILGLKALSPDATNAQIAIIAEEAVNLALGSAPSATPSTAPLPMSLSNPQEVDNPKFVTGNLSKHILVRNMFDKDEETDENWADDIRMEFQEEGGKYGKISLVKVMSEEPGGKIYASFESLEGAAACGEKFAGRWFENVRVCWRFYYCFNSKVVIPFIMKKSVPRIMEILVIDISS
jgi:RNA-binding protein 39